MGGIGAVFCKVVDGVCADVGGDTSGGVADCKKRISQSCSSSRDSVRVLP